MKDINLINQAIEICKLKIRDLSNRALTVQQNITLCMSILQYLWMENKRAKCLSEK